MRKNVAFVLIAKYIDARPGELPTAHNQAWQDFSVSFCPDSRIGIDTVDVAI
jgi:hypothetical protein